MPSSHPVIVVPGVTATYLRDLYPLPPETIWAVIRNDYDRVQLHPDDLRYEALEPSAVRTSQIYEVAYRELVEELRHNLASKADDPVPVFPFGYDWRQPLHVIEDQLADFIDEVIDRTSLMRNYHADPAYRGKVKVNLVGHSMGGLVVAGYLESRGGGKVNKVATLASPFRGSFEAMVKITTGTANIGGDVPSSREREAARVTPSLYHLLPSFDTGIILPPGSGLPKNTFNQRLWQPSIIATLVEYVRLHGRDETLSDAKRKEIGAKLFRGLLAGAGAHRDRLDGLDLAAKGFSTDRWLCVVGVGARTRVQMTIEKDGGAPVFRLTSEDRIDAWEEPEADRKLTGDGTVHFKGAIPAFLPYESLVCVSPDDFGYWEIQDKAVTRLAGFHGILPNMNMLHRMLVRHFTGWDDPRGNTWGYRAPGVEKGAWKPAVPLTDKTKDKTKD